MKGGKATGYFSDDWSWHTGYFYVEQAWAFSLFLSRPAMAILDTGATQTAGSAEAGWALVTYLLKVDSIFRYEVDVESRPWFHFGDGGWLRALSRVWLSTVLGRFGIYVLDAKGVPVLIGSDCCEGWGISISYKRNEAILENVSGMPKIALEKSASGHRLIDLTAEPM